MVQHRASSLAHPEPLNQVFVAAASEPISEQCRSLSTLFGGSSESLEVSYRANVCELLGQVLRYASRASMTTR